MTYQALTDLEQFGVDVTGTIHAAAVSLSRNTVFAAAAILVFALGLGLLAAVRARRKDAWLFARTTPLRFHYAWMAVMAVLLVIQLTHLNAPGAAAVAVATALVFAAAVFGLFTWRTLGPVAAVLFVWLALPVRELPFVLMFADELKDLSPYSVPGKAGMFAAGQMEYLRMLVMELAAAVLTAVLTGYYVRRRYLFRGLRDVFAGASACPKCGFPLIEETAFCPSCGCEVRGRAVSAPGIAFAVEPRFCVDCGSPLKEGECPRCSAGQSFSEQVRGSAKKELTDRIRSFLSGKAAVIAVAVILFAPLLVNNMSRDLTRDVNMANDAFVEKYVRWKEDPSVAEDPAWLASFDGAASELIAANARGFTMDTAGQSKADVYLYMQYLEASWYQMVVADRMVKAVHTGAVADAAALGSYFDGTQNAQLNALRSSLSMISERGFLSSLEDAVLDGLRFYFALPPLRLTAALLLAAGVLCAVLALLRRKKTTGEEALASVSLDTTDPEELEKLRAKGRAERKKERLYAAAGAALALLFILAGVGVSALRGGEAEEPDLTAVSEQTYIGSGVPLLDWTALCTSDPAAALADRENALALMAECRAGLAKIEDLTSGGENENPEAAAAAAALDAALARAQAALEGGALPDQATRTELARLLYAGMASYEQSIVSQAFQSVEDLF